MELASADVEVIDDSDIISISVNYPPLYPSFEYSLYTLGFGGERLKFLTSNGAVLFGIGLSDSGMNKIVRKVEEFCGRKLFFDEC